MIDNPITALIDEYGSEAKLGAALGVSQPAIQKAKRLSQVSPKMAVRIETVTGGRYKRWQMRPDLWEPPEGSSLNTSAPNPLAPGDLVAA